MPAEHLAKPSLPLKFAGADAMVIDPSQGFHWDLWHSARARRPLRALRKAGRMTGNNFEGVWILLPELSFYQDGGPPEDGGYEIGVRDGTAHLSVS